MKLAIIGDFNPSFRPHVATNEAIQHSIQSLGLQLETDWVSTDYITDNFKSIIDTYSGFWIAPGSPYKSMTGALDIIKYARLNNIPTLGTCGGFQHIVIEFARNVLNIKDAEHAEYDPYSSKLVVNPLSCAMAGQTLEIQLNDKTSKVFEIFGTEKIYEKYYCNFGLNPAYQDQLNDNGLKIVGTDDLKEARILELSNHPFFIATLFVPQDNSTIDKPHKLINAFLSNVCGQKGNELFYHGTKADLQIGDLLTAGFKSNYYPEVIMNHIYFTALVNGAGLAASLVKGEGRERVYIVEPTGSYENDPNVTDKKFPGNPTRSYRSQAPLKIVGEVSDWVRQTPEELERWRENLAKLLANPKAEIIN